MRSPAATLPVASSVAITMSPRLPKYWPLAAAALLCIVPAAHAQRVSAKDRAASDALVQRMSAAEQRYRDALVLAANGDPKGTTESNAALEDMEDVVDACIKQRGCEVGTMLAGYKRLLKAQADALGLADLVRRCLEPGDIAAPFHDGAIVALIGDSAA